MLKVRQLSLQKDYPEVCEWWRQWSLLKPETDWKYIPWNRLPETALLVCDDETKYCAGFLYKVEAGWSLLEWVVSNPKADKEKRSLALQELLKAATYVAGEFKVDIFSSINHPSLISKFEAAGFVKADTGMTNMIWKGSN